MFQYAEMSERVKKDLIFCSMVDNLNFGLEFYMLLGTIDTQTKKLLESGVMLCELLEKNPEDIRKGRIPDIEQLISSYELHNTLAISEEYFDELKLPKDYYKKAAEYRRILEKIINGENIPIKKIYEMQKFFDKVEKVLLHKARDSIENLGYYKRKIKSQGGY